MSSVVTKGLTRFLTAIVITLSACDLFVMLFSPWWLRIAYEKGYGELGIFFGSPYNSAHPGGSYTFMITFIWVCGALILGLFFEAFRILMKISKDTPFCMGNSRSFRNAAFYAFSLSLAFLIKMFFSPSILTLVCIGVFVLLAFFMVVLSELFRIATKIKEENELTI